MSNKDENPYVPPTKEFIRNALTYGLSSEQQEREDVNVPLDFTPLLALGIDDFIRQLYLRALNRLPDPQAIEHWRSALINGAKKEAIIYVICTSREFAQRRQVAHLSEYQKAHRMYQIRERIKRTPGLGWLWSFVAIPRTLVRLSESLMLHFSTLQTSIATSNAENSRNLQTLSTKLERLSSQQDALQAQLDEANQIIVEQQNALKAQLETANQNVIKAHVKLDENGVAILGTLYQNKPFIYSLPGGVTAVQTKDYIIGVPSEQWRLAVFLSLYGSLEIGTEKYFRSILRREMNVLDVGAYIGIYTLHALAAGCKVYSYEPTPRIFDILLENIGINGFEPTKRANAFNLAVSNMEGQTEFSLEGSGHGQNNSLYAIHENDKKIEVNTIYLDKHLGDVDHIDVAKIDVEGAEPLVLMGMREIVAKNPSIRIIMEFAPSHLKRAGKDPLEFIQQIHSMDLGIRLIDEQSGQLREISDQELCQVYSVNVLLEKSL
jgi:FkbM family methyltransferase